MILLTGEVGMYGSFSVGILHTIKTRLCKDNLNHFPFGIRMWSYFIRISLFMFVFIILWLLILCRTNKVCLIDREIFSLF